MRFAEKSEYNGKTFLPFNSRINAAFPNQMFDLLQERNKLQTRRSFFGKAATGLGSAALATLLTKEPAFADEKNAANSVQQNLLPALPGLPHFAAKAKRVIYLFMNGGATHTDLFDYKPKQAEMHGKPVPREFFKGKRFSTMTGNPQGKLMLAPVEPYRQYGESGAWASDFMPHIGSMSDDICYIKSMYTEQVNHAPAVTFFLTGSEMAGRPTMGAWLTYGLGTRNGRTAIVHRDDFCQQRDFVWADFLRLLLGQWFFAFASPRRKISLGR